jgi:hypothetical protein
LYPLHPCSCCRRGEELDGHVLTDTDAKLSVNLSGVFIGKCRLTVVMSGGTAILCAHNGCYCRGSIAACVPVQETELCVGCGLRRVSKVALPGQRCQNIKIASAEWSLSPGAGQEVRLSSGTVAGCCGTLYGSSFVPCQVRSWYNRQEIKWYSLTCFVVLKEVAQTKMSVHEKISNLSGCLMSLNTVLVTLTCYRILVIHLMTECRQSFTQFM